MDRDRLKQVQQTDLTESRLNQEFVYWLKERGPTVLLAILIGLVALVGIDRWRQSRQSAHSGAYYDLESASDAEGFEKVAEDHAGVGAVSELARLRAGDIYLIEVDAGRDMKEPDQILDDAAIEERLDKAEEMYQRVLTDTRENTAMRLFAIQAHFGLAVVAEARGEFDQARSHYEDAATLAGDQYPTIADHARKREESLATLDASMSLPRRADLPHPSPVDPLLRDLLLPVIEAESDSPEEVPIPESPQSEPSESE